jgi:hypothetical protein
MRSGWKAVIGGVLGALPISATAQTPFNAGQEGQNEAPNVGGTPTVDLILIKSETPSVPLRNGGLILGSELVQLDGLRLTRGVDYQLDLESGVIYLMRTPQPGQSLVVSYRFEPSKAKTAANQFAGLPRFKFDVAPGGFKMGSLIVGLGVAERRSDGNVVTSNLYGWAGDLKVGNGKLRGLMMVGEKDRVEASSNFEYQDVGQANDLGKSRFIVQSLQTGFMGGTVEADYQDISKNFSGFSAAQDAGFDAKRVGELQKERGLKRLGLSVKGLDIGGMKFSNGFRNVQDGERAITWRNFGFGFGGLTLDWASRHVEQGFNRFQDLAEAEREQLRKEAGMTRETFAAAFDSKAAKMSLNVADIADQAKNSIKRSEFKIDAQKFRFTFGEQEVPKDFTRMASLLDAEKAMWGRELGLSRQWTALEASLFKGQQPIHFAQSFLRSDSGEYSATDFDATINGWSLQHIDRDVSDGFDSMGGMQDAERNGHINAISRMYDPKGFGPSGNDVAWFMRGAGIGRSLSRISGAPFKGWNLAFDHLELEGKLDGGAMDTLNLTGKGFRLNWKGIRLGDQFDDVARLMDFERARIGAIPGLDQEAFNLNFGLGKNQISIDHMSADTNLGGAERTTLGFQGKDINVSVSAREVDPGFTNVNQLADPEKDFLAVLRGFRERDIRASWQILPTLKIETFNFAATDSITREDRMVANHRITWNPDKLTKFGYVRLEQKSDDPLRVLFANVTEQMSLFRDFGKLGKLTYMTVTRDYDGAVTSLPDSERRLIAYEAQINPKTTVRASESDTRFEDGNHENISSKSLSTEIMKGSGLSVTDVNVDRKGTDNDEKKRNYGFWVDLGQGIRFSIGKAQNLNNGQATPQTPGLIEGSPTSLAQMAAGVPAEPTWAQADNEATTYQLATQKPINLLGFKDMQFKWGFDNARERTRWTRENRNMSWSAKFLNTFLGYDFRGQLAPNGKRATDKSFTITTDQTESKPFRASFFYKERRLPDGDPIIIRNFSVAAKPVKNVELTHQLLTNPEVVRGDAVLGSITQAQRLNRWKLDVKRNANLTIGGSFEEIMDKARPLSRVAGLNFLFNEATGSPLKIFYGVEQSDRGGKRYTTQRYSLQFDQKPGKNQVLSIFVGNVSYQHTIENGKHRNNWTIRADYQIKF